MDTLEQVEKKLGSLAVLQEQTKGIEERLATVNALGEHVSLKAKALESQKHMVDRAVVEASRLNEMVRAMDVQIQRLNDGNGQIASTEQMLGRVEKLAQETARQLDSALKVKDAFRHDIGRLEKETTTLADSVRGHLERWSIEKKEFDGVDQRLRALQAAVSRAEVRIDTVGASDKAIGQLAHGAETVSKHLHELSAQIRRAYGEAVVAPGAAGPTDRDAAI
jgi:DNA repair exonuclease SbcCD ATPase subunit